MFQNQLQHRAAQQPPLKNKPTTGRSGGIAGAMGRYSGRQPAQQLQPVEEEDEGNPQLPARITIHQAVNLLSLRMCNVETQLIDLHRKSFESATSGVTMDADAASSDAAGGGGGGGGGASGETVLMLMQRLDALEQTAARPATSSVEMASLRMDLGKIRTSLNAVIKEAQSLRSRVETNSADIMQLKSDVISTLDAITAAHDESAYQPDYVADDVPVEEDVAAVAVGQKRPNSPVLTTIDDNEIKVPKLEPPTGTTPLF